jgi:hypothetical protein
VIVIGNIPGDAFAAITDLECFSAVSPIASSYFLFDF